ncbi:MAG: L,D-transpeptidase family protein [Ferruginibacter sp.]
MQNCKTIYRYYPYFFIFLFFVSCSNNEKIKDEDIVTDPVTMDTRVAENINIALKYAMDNSGNIDDSAQIKLPKVVREFYNKINYRPVWSSTEKWLPLADSLYRFITGAEAEGLFPEDYHFQKLKFLKDTLDADSITRMNASYWTKADLLFTDAFMHLLKDLKQGRLQPDSLSLNKDSVLVDKFFIATLNELFDKQKFTDLLNSLQPKHKEYWELKKSIKAFTDTMDRKPYSSINYPFKRGNVKDSLFFISMLQKRLLESGCIDSRKSLPDSAQLFKAIKKYQLRHGLQPDGKYGKQVVNSLNNTDVEKFNRIAVTLDKYKQLPEKMPEKYIWVNLPGYYLWMIDADTLVFESKVIVGKPETRTPLLTSEISDMITYPTWTVPNSIIVKQYLPRLKTNPNYISKIGLKLMNSKGEVIDPTTINWSKYSRGIPYKVVQGSGDNNSLGVIKFNFNNPYYVYLHDTNQRYLFKNSSRALSHGCVRVQDWQKLASYIADNDSLLSTNKTALKYTSDSIKNWIDKKERHRVDVKNHIPLYIRYFTCGAKKGKIFFYDDIYGDDKELAEKYFAKRR